MIRSSKHKDQRIRTAVIGGSGSSSLLSGKRIRHRHQLRTPYGKPSSEILEAEFNGVLFYLLYRHGAEHTLAPHAINYRANISALAQLEVSSIVSIATVGGIAPTLDLGDLVVPDQIIDYTWGRASTFFDGSDGKVAHLEITHPYSTTLRQEILLTAPAANVEVVDRGVYAVTQGPRFETAAEVDRIEKDGGDIVGMTGMPEAALAAELGLHYACIAVVVNAAAGRGDSRIDANSIEFAFNDGYKKIDQLFRSLLNSIDRANLEQFEPSVLHA